MPLGCMGSIQVTTETLSDMVTTSTTSTIPGATEYNNYIKSNIQEIRT